MTQITTTTDIMHKVPKGFKAHNLPKPNSISMACAEITRIVLTKGQAVEGLSLFGHKLKAKNGTIDTVIFSGKVHTMQNFIDALSNSGLERVEKHRKMYPRDTFEAVLAHRVVEHVEWCANETKNSHGSFYRSLKRVGLTDHRKKLGELLTELSAQLNSVYKAEYYELYKGRAKAAIK